MRHRWQWRAGEEPETDMYGLGHPGQISMFQVVDVICKSSATLEIPVVEQFCARVGFPGENPRSTRGLGIEDV
jgi:hypothetical protein